MPLLNLSSIHRTPIFTLNLIDSNINKVYGATYSGKTKLWNFPAFYPVASIVLSDLKKLYPSLTLSTDVVQHLAQLDNPIPSLKFITVPYTHQVEGLNHAYKYLRSGLFYSPGLGKCKIIVDLHRLTQDKILILCPCIMLDTWKEEFQKHGGISDVLVIDGYNKKKKQSQLAQAHAHPPVATVVSYTVATLYPEQILKIPYDVIVADESHQLKTPFSKRTKAVSLLANRAYRRILLSGTPSLGSPFDMYGQLRFLGKYFCAEDWWSFKKLFGVFPAWERNERAPKILLGFKNLDLLNERVNLICVRKTKEECLDLPDQQIIDTKFPLYPQQKEAYNQLILDRADKLGLVVKEALDDNTLDHSAGTTLPPYVLCPEPITLINKLDQINSGFVYLTSKNPRLCDGCTFVNTCVATEVQAYTSACRVISKEDPCNPRLLKKNARLDKCTDLLESILEDPSNKVIVWAKYTQELKQLTELTRNLKVTSVIVQGGMSSSEVTAAMQKFQTDPACRIYLGHVATGVGVTLNSANYTIYYNIPWNLDHYLQSIDRNYRIGQDRKVTVYRLIARDTIDEAKAAAVDQKMDFSALVTSRSLCAICSEFTRRCAPRSINLFDEECKYDRTMLRETAKIGLIP